jgi:AraC-like DNA-binding protein
VPRGGHVTLRAATLACRVVVLSFHEPLLAIVASTYKKLGFERGQLDRWFARMEVLPRTVWIHEIVHRYVFERHGLGEDDNVATRFLETEILKEVYFLFRDRDAGADRATMVRKYSAYIERSVAYVDAHVFEPCSVADLAEFAGASASTLLRAFRRELGCSPGAYWRSRKLDEALLLLRAGCYGVAEVATAVGYENPTAFAHAFRVRFGCPPSKFLPRRHP